MYAWIETSLGKSPDNLPSIIVCPNNSVFFFIIDFIRATTHLNMLYMSACVYLYMHVTAWSARLCTYSYSTVIVGVLNLWLYTGVENLMSSTQACSLPTSLRRSRNICRLDPWLVEAHLVLYMLQRWLGSHEDDPPSVATGHPSVFPFPSRHRPLCDRRCSLQEVWPAGWWLWPPASGSGAWGACGWSITVVKDGAHQEDQDTLEVVYTALFVMRV